MNSVRVRKTGDGRYYYDIWYKGRRYRKLTNLSKNDTNQAGLEKLKELERSTLGILESAPILFEDFADKFMEKHLKENKRSWLSDENSLKSLKPFFKNTHISNIAAERVEDYKAKRKKDVSPASVNRELALFKTIMSKAVDWGYLAVNPIAGKKVKKFPEENIKERILTIQETGRLMNAAGARLKSF